MNGPEHYKAAEKLLSRASFMDSRGRPTDGEAAANLTALAQAHATLAHAAAAALPIVTQFMGDSDLVTAWGTAIGWVIPAEIVEDDE